MPSIVKCFNVSNSSEMDLKIKMMQSRLEQKLEEGRNVNQELNQAKEEKLKLEQENMRLRHRSEFQN